MRIPYILVTMTLLGMFLFWWSPFTISPGETFGSNGTPQQPKLIRVYSQSGQGYIMVEKIHKTEAEWKAQLTPVEYSVTRRNATEMAFTGKYWNMHEDGIYRCVCCGTDLFSSQTKFDSGTGWPSFWAPIAKENVTVITDLGLGMVRVEVRCSRCGAHLGHVFEDGPDPTGLRYCINSAALEFLPDKKQP
jgi:peptide-methionine (R)-S-oxide reductase